MAEISPQNPPTPPTRAPKFPQFDVATDFSDHHFFAKQPKPASLSGSAQKKIMQEWKLLARDLPDSIYVRAYETRVDLLRAAIVGARGTPYHDGLFFFDISFPSDYPARPPLVHFWSFGYRVNPNLYNSGKVCLSLLNTWTGKKSEKWDRQNSTILQVLLSLQGLVLNEKPYFNEPGYSALSGKTYGEKKSLAYSQDAFVLNCKIMLFVLRKPPKNFEALVTEHFKDRGEFILNACDMYRRGLVKVGMFNGVVKAGYGTVSASFKTSLNQWFGDLTLAIARTGAPVQCFVEQVRLDREQKAKEAAASVAAAAAKKQGKKSNPGEVGKGVVSKLRKIFAGLMTVKKQQKSKTNPVSDVSPVVA